MISPGTRVPLIVVVLLALSLVLYTYSPPRATFAPVPLACPSCPTLASNKVELELLMLRHNVKLLRGLSAGHICTRSDIVLPSGGWCLFPDPRYPDMPNGVPIAQHHAPADSLLSVALYQLFRGKRIIDFGAGIGQYEAAWATMGGEVRGTPIDGALNVEEYTNGTVMWADLTGPFYHPDSPFDWVLSLEVGEHIPKQHMGTLLDNIDRNNICGVVLSWAVPGQGGHSHVNELPNEVIIAEMTRRGYEYMEAASLRMRQSTQYGWFRYTVMIFRRNVHLPSCANAALP